MDKVSSAFVADPELVSELEKRAEPVSFEADRVLFREGEAPKGVFVLRKGFVRLTSPSDGDAILSVQAGPGSLLGVPAVVAGKPYSLTAEALEGAELSLMPNEAFVDLLRTEPVLSFRVLQVLAEEVRFARESISHL